MVNITHKSNSLRIAIASAVISVSRPETIGAIKNKTVPKGDVFEFARAAGLLAIKKTSDVIPDCHPLPVEYAAITFETRGQEILIRTEVHTIYKTGVEVEAMHGAAITALTIYDMLKPIDQSVEIKSVRLESKRGGKSENKKEMTHQLRCAVVVCSDSVSSGKAEDRSGKIIMDKLAVWNISASQYEVIPDDFSRIQDKVNELVQQGYDLTLFTGGTGLSPKDVTPEAITPLIDREIPGLMEAARHYGQQRTPYAMLSRGVAGFIKNMLIITMPGSPQGVSETMDALFPYVLHVFRVAEGIKHEN